MKALGLHPGFNSKLVRLKAKTVLPSGQICFCFNSKLVRLKVLMETPARFMKTRFNSKLVRLKAVYHEVYHPDRPFQFQTGAIKSDPTDTKFAKTKYGFNSKLVRLKVIGVLVI